LHSDRSKKKAPGVRTGTIIIWFGSHTRQRLIGRSQLNSMQNQSSGPQVKLTIKNTNFTSFFITVPICIVLMWCFLFMLDAECMQDFEELRHHL